MSDDPQIAELERELADMRCVIALLHRRLTEIRRLLTGKKASKVKSRVISISGDKNETRYLQRHDGLEARNHNPEGR
jgi:hypothetical protein